MHTFIHRPDTRKFSCETERKATRRFCHKRGFRHRHGGVGYEVDGCRTLIFFAVNTLRVNKLFFGENLSGNVGCNVFLIALYLHLHTQWLLFLLHLSSLFFILFFFTFLCSFSFHSGLIFQTNRNWIRKWKKIVIRNKNSVNAFPSSLSSMFFPSHSVFYMPSARQAHLVSMTMERWNFFFFFVASGKFVIFSYGT